MALMGAEALLYPTAIGTEPLPAPPVDSRDHWRRVMQGHAGANYVPLIASNRIGTEKGAEWRGDSVLRIIVHRWPHGRDRFGITGRTQRRRDCGVVRHSSEEIAKMRASWGLFRDRRPELYDTLKAHHG